MQYKALTKRLVGKDYNENYIQQQVPKTFVIRRVPTKPERHETSNSISLILTYKSTLKRAVNNHCDISKINKEFEKLSYRSAYYWQKYDRQQQKTICQGINQNYYLKSCNSKLNNLFCNHVQSINTFKSTIPHKLLKLYLQ